MTLSVLGAAESFAQVAEISQSIDFVTMFGCALIGPSTQSAA